MGAGPREAGERCALGRRIVAGYSGTPLAKKLGVASGQRSWRFRMPASVAEEIRAGRMDPILLDEPEAGLQMAHLFVTSRRELAEMLARLLPLLAADGMIWVSWPKKSSGVRTDMTEDAIRSEALPLGLVDIKVCAIDETWSGLKLVIRKERRARKAARL